MNKIKSLYEAPTTDVLVVRFEENIMSPTNERMNTTTMDGTWGMDD